MRALALCLLFVLPNAHADEIARIAIDGVVVDGKSRAPLKGATITTDTEVKASTNRDGRFVLELEADKWPKRITVRADGFGERVVAVPSARVKTTLEEIALLRGITVVAEIQQTVANQVRTVELMQLSRRAPGDVLRTLTLEPSEDLARVVRFESIAPGKYVVTARGEEGTQRAGVAVDVGERSIPPAQLQIIPFTLNVHTGINGQSEIFLRNHDVFWETRVPLDSSGEASLSLWQGGAMSATVAAGGHVPYRVRRSVETTDTEWVLEMPDLRVEGKVIDAESGAPIENAALALEMTSEVNYQHLSVSEVADEKGAFMFKPVFAGEHRIRAAAKGYPVSEQTYTFEATDETKSLTIALTRRPMTTVKVVDARGVPMRGIDVHVFRGATSIDFARTGTDGTMPIYIEDGGERTLFVVPRDGSLGIAHVKSGTPEVVLTLPDGSSRIVIRAESDRHEPIPHLFLDVTYNGVVLPVRVMEALHARGSKTVSGDDGRLVFLNMPPGLYEFAPQELAFDAPLRVNAVPGENVAVMTFAAAPPD